MLGWAESGVKGAEFAAEDGVEGRAVFVGGDAVLDGMNFAESGVEDGCAGILFEGEDEV